jgi:biopolymer transport protein TolQ
MAESALHNNLFAVAQAGHLATLYILGLLSILSVAFIIERFFAIRGVESKNQTVNKRIQDALQSNELSMVEELSKDRDSLVGRGLSYGVRHTKSHGAVGLEEIFNTYSLVEKPSLEKRLNFLATVGSNAPFIGLLGTVFGIMDAFRSLGTSQGEMTVVMVGISDALVATAIGLFVAIPAVVSYNFYQRKVKSLMQSLESARDLCLAYAKTKKGGA